VKFDWIFEHDQIISPIVGLVAAALCFFMVRRLRRQRQLRHVVAVESGKLPRPLPRFYPWRRGLITGVILSTLYLLAFRGISLAPHYFNDNKGGAILMSFAFLFFGPLMAGCVTIVQAPNKEPWSIKASLIAPWIPILVNLIIAIGVKWEGIICAVFILPPALISASLGGLIIGLFQRYLYNKHTRTTVYCLAALPLLLAMVEAKLTQPLQTRTVDTSIVIQAPLSIVWQNIERVRAIDPSELRRSWSNTIGFPRPVEATLSHEGIGGVRNASFEHGLDFTETITEWVPNQRIVFTIKADTANIPRTTLDEHVTVGGRFFDVLTGEYDLHSLPNGDILLHLSSRERLSTDFNIYAAMWSDAVMRDMQSNILHVIRNRCESQPQPAQASTLITNH
jgi:uncharacterized protein YndB with AHSA1/START domain